MPEVPNYHLKPLKSIYVPKDPTVPASLKQKSLIITMCEKRKINIPDLKDMKMGEAAKIIDLLLDSRN